MTLRLVLVLGGPGSGKGTQCGKMATSFGFVPLSAGELIRAEKAANSALGETINEYDEQGQLLPGSVVMQVLEKAISAEQAKGHNDFLLDGFPRSMDNVEALNAKWKKNVCLVLSLQCPEEVLEKRLLGRGQAGSGRWDDMDVQVIRRRLENFRLQSAPVVEMSGCASEAHHVLVRYQSTGIVKTIDSNAPIDEVSARVFAVLQAAGFSRIDDLEEAPDVDLSVVLAVYLFGDLGYWVVPAPFLPLTPWMAYKVSKQRASKAVTDKVTTVKAGRPNWDRQAAKDKKEM